MKFNICNIIKLSLTSAAVAAALTQTASAAWTNDDNMLEVGTTISNLGFNSSTVGFTGNPALNNDAWGMQGAFTNFYVSDLATVTIDARSSVSNYPAFSVFRTEAQYSGETVGADTPAEVTGQIHKFNSVGQAGDPGIMWATGPGGIVETLGYVSSSSNDYVNSYGGVIDSGARDVSIDDLYETGISGSIGTVGNPAFATSKRFATLTLENLVPGWYALFVGGADILGTSSGINLSLSAAAPSAVPVPAAVWLFGSAMAGLAGTVRRKRLA